MQRTYYSGSGILRCECTAAEMEQLAAGEGDVQDEITAEQERFTAKYGCCTVQVQKEQPRPSAMRKRLGCKPQRVSARF